MVRLARKVAKTALWYQIEAIGQGGTAQIQKGSDHLRVQGAVRQRHLGDMATDLAREFAGVHEAARAAAKSAT